MMGKLVVRRLSEWFLGAAAMERGVKHFSEFSNLGEGAGVLTIRNEWENFQRDFVHPHTHNYQRKSKCLSNVQESRRDFKAPRDFPLICL